MHAALAPRQSLATVPPDRAVSVPLLVFYGVVQVVRLWVMAKPGALLDHPGPSRCPACRGCAGVPTGISGTRTTRSLVVEIALLPMVFGDWQVALLFSALNAALLTWRISVENKGTCRKDPKVPQKTLRSAAGYSVAGSRQRSVLINP